MDNIQMKMISYIQILHNGLASSLRNKDWKQCFGKYPGSSEMLLWYNLDGHNKVLLENDGRFINWCLENW